MSRLHRWLAIGAAAFAVAAVAPGAAVAQSTSRDAASSSDALSDAVMRREIESARARGVPAEPLFAKVREGRLKRATPPRIRAAVMALATRLDSARAILGPDAATDELTAGADALAAGASPSALRTVTAAAPSRPISAPLGALAQLVASGVPTDRAAAMIVELLQHKVGRAQLLAFGNLVESDVASGVPAQEAAVFRLRAIGSLATQAGVAGVPSDVPSIPSRAGLMTNGARPATPTPKRRP